MRNRIDNDLFAVDAIDDPVREDLQREAAQVAAERRAQAREPEQELNRIVCVSEKPLCCTGRPLGEIRCRFGKLLICLGYEADAHG
jgi:hypothetical protein